MLNRNTLGYRIKSEREYRGIKQYELAQMIGEQYGIKITPTAISKIEAGWTQTPTLDTLVAISQILNVSIDYLVTGEEVRRSARPFSTPEANKIIELVDAMNDDSRYLMLAIAKRLAAMESEIATLLSDGIELMQDDQAVDLSILREMYRNNTGPAQLPISLQPGVLAPQFTQ